MTISAFPDLRVHIAGLLEAARATVAPAQLEAKVVIERPKQAQHGDYACNVAMQLAKPLRRNPRDIAAALIAALPASPYVAKTEIAGAGFINFFLKPEAHQAAVAHILALGAGYGISDAGGKRKVQVEFVSANPTGPLHVGHGRQAALGDAIAALLEAQGYAVTREFYYNDAGVQIQNLALSVQARTKGIKPGDPGWPADAYQGEYIQDIATDFLARNTVGAADGVPVVGSGDRDDLESIRKFAVAYLRHEQDGDLQRFDVKFDVYYLETPTGGDVELNSITREGRDVHFVLVQEKDGVKRRLNVIYNGADPLPDTFKDNAPCQALVDGKLGSDNVFRANKLQAKCASKYEAKPVAPVSRG